MRTITKKRFHHLSQWLSKVTRKQLEETMSARLLQRNLQKDQLWIKLMLLKKQWMLLTLKLDFQAQLQTNLENYKSITPSQMLLSIVEWNLTVTSTQMESVSDQLRSIKRSSLLVALIKKAVDKRVQELEQKAQARRKLKSPRVTQDKCKVFNKTWTKTSTKRSLPNKETREQSNNLQPKGWAQ